MSATSSMSPPLDPMREPSVHVVTDVIDEIDDVVTIRSTPVDGVPHPFRPAQVSMVGAFGVGEAAISISSRPSVEEYREHTIRRAGAITSALTRMRPGDHFWVRGPFGAPWQLDLDGDDLVIAAGGIGLAPLRSAVYEVVDHRERFGRVVLVVGARRAADLLYRREYAGWRARGLEVVETIDRPERGWRGAVGFVHEVVDEVVGDARRTHAAICGPDVMMRSTAEVLVDAGVEVGRIQLTLERNMQCGTGRCGHCQLGGLLVCRDGPVVPYPRVRTALSIAEW